jgi:multiple sugar transport system substrate-binding protein
MAGLLAVLSACGGGQVGLGDAGGSKETTAKVNKEPAELTIFYPFPADWPPEVFERVFAEPIKKKFPHVTIKYISAVKGSSIPELITAGQKLDIVFTSIGATFAQLIDNALQYDITPLIKKYNYDLDKLDPAMIEVGRKLAEDKGIYGLPVYVPPSTMYYNKDLFDKFGAAYPKDGVTWDELYELANKLTRSDGGVQYVGLGSSYGHLTLLNQLSLPMIDVPTKKAMIDKDERWKPFVENLVRFYKFPGVAQVSSSWSEPHERNRFIKDRTVAMFLAQTALFTETELTGFSWDFAAYPVFKDKPTVGPQAYPVNFYVTSQSEHKDQAFEVVAFLASEEFQAASVRAGSFLSTLKDTALRSSFGVNSTLYKGKNVKAMQPQTYAPPGSIHKYNATVQSEINVGIVDVVKTGKDVNTMLRGAAEKANIKIDTLEAAAKK